MQRLGANSEDSNTIQSVPSSPAVEEVIPEKVESPVPVVEQTPIFENNGQPEEIEESHTPPLPPCMLKPKQVDLLRDGKRDKKGDWDMFAEQDTFGVVDVSFDC